MRRTTLLSILSIAIILVLILFDLEFFKRGITSFQVSGLANDYEKYSVILNIGNFLFKICGLVIVVLTLAEWIRKRKHVNRMTKILWIYSAIAVGLSLPIYKSHYGFGGSNTHGHSFWDTQTHFH